MSDTLVPAWDWDLRNAEAKELIWLKEEMGKKNMLQVDYDHTLYIKDGCSHWDILY